MRPAHIKGQRKKEHRRLNKEWRKIRKEIRELPLIELDKPVRHGWYKEIVLTENIERYPRRDLIKEIFELLDTHCWGRTKKKSDEQWSKQRSKHFIFNDFPTISKKQFNGLSEKAQQICIPFQYRECKKLLTRFYVRIPKGAYMIKYTRAYITHRKTHDPDLESRLEWISQRLESRELYSLNAYNYKNTWHTKPSKVSRIKSKQVLRKYKNASVRGSIEELWERNYPGET